jgi:hypothetical protein
MNLVILVSYDKIGFLRQTLLSQLIYLIIPKMVQKLKCERESLVENVHLFITKYIEEIDLKFKREYIINQAEENEENTIINMIEYFPHINREIERLSYYFS